MNDECKEMQCHVNTSHAPLSTFTSAYCAREGTQTLFALDISVNINLKSNKICLMKLLKSPHKLANIGE